MPLIDRYIIKRFFQFFVYATLAALAIYLVVDPIENLDKFIDKGVPRSEIIRYYILYIPYIVYLTFPVAMLLATMFCIGGLTSSNEMLAMSSSGIPLYRQLFLLGFTGLILSGTIFLFGETVVPYSNKERMAIWRSQVKKRVDWRLMDQGQVYIQLGSDRVLHLDLYQPKLQTGNRVEILRFDGNQIIQRVNAPTISWNGEKWILQDAVTRDFSTGNEIVNHEERIELEFDLIPEDLVELNVEPEEMGYNELKKYAERIEMVGGRPTRWVVDIHGKAALPFAGLVIVLFGIPVSAVRRRSGMIIGVTYSLLISFFFFGFIQVGKVLGYKEIISPWMGAWLGNIIFVVLGISIYFRAPK